MAGCDWDRYETWRASRVSANRVNDAFHQRISNEVLRSPEPDVGARGLGNCYENDLRVVVRLCLGWGTRLKYNALWRDL